MEWVIVWILLGLSFMLNLGQFLGIIPVGILRKKKGGNNERQGEKGNIPHQVS